MSMLHVCVECISYLINITMHFKQCSSHAQQKDGYGSLNSFGHDEDEYGDGGDVVVVVGGGGGGGGGGWS